MKFVSSSGNWKTFPSHESDWLNAGRKTRRFLKKKKKRKKKTKEKDHYLFLRKIMNIFAGVKVIGQLFFCDLLIETLSDKFFFLSVSRMEPFLGELFRNLLFRRSRSG